MEINPPRIFWLNIYTRMSPNVGFLAASLFEEACFVNEERLPLLISLVPLLSVERRMNQHLITMLQTCCSNSFLVKFPFALKELGRTLRLCKVTGAYEVIMRLGA